MISLRLRVDVVDGPREAFVVRLNSDPSGPLGPDDLVLREVGSSLEYSSSAVVIRIEGAQSEDLDGNVILVNPQRRVAQRLIRPDSRHNTFLVTERCDQLCVMCSQPPKASDWNHFPLFAQAALLAPRDAVIGVSGGEPTLLKEDLFEFLEKVSAARPDLGFHVLTNAQHFEPTDGVRLKSLADRVEWGIPLYSHDPDVHDTIVGKVGAYSRLEDGLALMAAAGARVELRTVLTSLNHKSLAWLAHHVTRHVPFAETWAIMQLENIGYGRLNWNKLFVDTGQNFRHVGDALTTAVAHGITPRLYNFPLCTVPLPFRKYAIPSISDWKQKFIAECSACSSRNTCGGFFEWYPEGHGFGGIAAI